MELLKVIELVPQVVIGFVIFAFVMITLDRRRENSPSKDDTQVELKIVIYGLALAGLGLAAMGVWQLLSYVLGGFKGGAGPIKDALAPILVGGGTLVAMVSLFLPRTNAATIKQAEQIALMVISALFGTFAIIGGFLLISDLIHSASWSGPGGTADGLATVLVAGAVAFLAIDRLGKASGWTMPVRPATPMNPPGYPQQGGGYPPQQGGGYPPQGGGYPPQGGGYPPPGGGYPPQQGGGGGYPPR